MEGLEAVHLVHVHHALLGELQGLVQVAVRLGIVPGEGTGDGHVLMQALGHVGVHRGLLVAGIGAFKPLLPGGNGACQGLVVTGHQGIGRLHAGLLSLAVVGGVALAVGQVELQFVLQEEQARVNALDHAAELHERGLARQPVAALQTVGLVQRLLGVEADHPDGGGGAFGGPGLGLHLLVAELQLHGRIQFPGVQHLAPLHGLHHGRQPVVHLVVVLLAAVLGDHAGRVQQLLVPLEGLAQRHADGDVAGATHDVGLRKRLELDLGQPLAARLEHVHVAQVMPQGVPVEGQIAGVHLDAHLVHARHGQGRQVQEVHLDVRAGGLLGRQGSGQEQNEREYEVLHARGRVGSGSGVQS